MSKPFFFLSQCYSVSNLLVYCLFIIISDNSGCVNSNCQNGGQCTPLADSCSQYYCSCPPCYYGQFCESREYDTDDSATTFKIHTSLWKILEKSTLVGVNFQMPLDSVSFYKIRLITEGVLLLKCKISLYTRNSHSLCVECFLNLPQGVCRIPMELPIISIPFD